ncbi:MAG: hypothetical protein ABIR91_00650 [Candidatus Saccharimonadales bacterium]
MQTKKLIGASLVSVGMVAGLAGFAGATSGAIGTTGPDSNNVITHRTSQRTDVRNNNNVTASNHNDQQADTGNATARHNTTAGATKTGDAHNANALNASVSIENKAPAAGGSTSASSNMASSIDRTGPDSNNVVRSTVDMRTNIDNDNDIRIDNTNRQTATSGDARVSGNTTGGSATTGNASNTNTTSMTFKITN